MQPSESVQLVPGQKVNGREGSARLVNIVQSTTVVSGPVEWLIPNHGSRITVHGSVRLMSGPNNNGREGSGRAADPLSYPDSSRGDVAEETRTGEYRRENTTET